MHENCLALDRASKIRKGMVGNKGGIRGTCSTYCAIDCPAIVLKNNQLANCTKT